MNALKQFFKYPETMVGVVTAFAFLLIFFCIWMTAYDGALDRTKELKVGLVNEDQQIGTMIEENLVKHLPFKTSPYESIDTAKQDMNQRELDMVIVIPKHFSNQIQENGKSDIEYFINQANAAMAKQTMEGAANTVTQLVNEQVYTYKQQLTLSNLTEQTNSIVHSKELAQKISNDISNAVQSLTIQSVESSIEKTNNAEGFAVTMVPLMIVLASFVGSMIMSMNMNVVSIKLKNLYNKWSIFLARQIINLGASILLAVITLMFLAIFQVELNTSVFEAGLFQTLVIFSFLTLTQMFMVLFGPAGMLFNIISLSLQLVTSGVIVPIVMLSSFYQIIGSFFPATYAAEGYYTIIFGGGGLSTDMMSVLLLSGITLIVAVIRTGFMKTNLIPENEELTISKTSIKEN